MNTCKKCGLAFYGAIGENYCGTCRKRITPDGAGESGRKPSDPDGAKRPGFWRRLFGGKKQG